MKGMGTQRDFFWFSSWDSYKFSPVCRKIKTHPLLPISLLSSRRKQQYFFFSFITPLPTSLATFPCDYPMRQWEYFSHFFMRVWSCHPTRASLCHFRVHTYAISDSSRNTSNNEKYVQWGPPKRKKEEHKCRVYVRLCACNEILIRSQEKNRALYTT